MAAVMSLASSAALSSEPVAQGRLVRQGHRSRWDTENSFECLGEGCVRSQHDLEADGAGLPGEEVLARQLLIALNQVHEYARHFIWRVGGDDPLVDPLPDDRREDRLEASRGQAAELLPDQRVAVRVPDLHDR